MPNDAVIYGKVVTPCGIIEDGRIVVRNGRIAEIGVRTGSGECAGSVVLDRRGLYVVPGFVDIHCHGGDGIWSFEEPERFAQIHLRHGTTSILPTFTYNQTPADIIAGLERVAAAMERGRTSIAGIHMEGPYINPKYGAITAPIRAVDPEEYEKILALAGDKIKLWTLAPELDGQTAFMERAAAYDIVFSVGHSEASPEVIFAGVPLGLRLGCHLTNASGVTPQVSGYAGTREVEVHEAVLVHPDMYAEVIPDRDGIHVRPLMLQLIVKAKGVDQVIVITDAIDLAGLPADTDVNIIAGNEHTPSGRDRILSGSLLTMDVAVHNMRRHTGIDMVDACKMAALNPARLLGLDAEIGSIEAGKKANLLLVTERLRVCMVMLEGEIVHQVD